MVKVTGQSVPSERKHEYEAHAELARPDGTVRRRYPKRIADHPLPKKLIQQTRFKQAIALFKDTSYAQRQRWYDSMPPWGSYLWYYNWFMLSALMGVTGLPPGSIAVIKSIQVLKDSVPKTGTKNFTIDTVDPAKCVVMIQGSARKVPKILRGSGSIATGGSTLNLGDTVDPDKCTLKLFGASRKQIGEYTDATVWPYISSLSATQIGIAWSYTPDQAAIVGWELTEHFEGTVHPVQVSIEATSVVIDWAEVPDADANVSITVIEYI